MKGLMKKALSFVMMMAMVATMLVLPNVEAKAANYYVAGSKTLCGVEWKENAAQNKMTANGDGTYSITYKDVAVGTHEFKVTDGTWTNSWGNGSNNYIVVIEEKSDVTIKFNSSTKKN